MSARQRHRLRLKSFIFFFSRSEIFERTFGLANWLTRLCLSRILYKLWRRKKKKSTKTMIESYLLLGMSSHHDRLSRHREERALWFFFECATTRLPESRVKRCQIKYKMRARLSPSHGAREKMRRSLFTNVNCALRRYIYFFDVNLFYVRVCVMCMRCEERKH